MRLMQPQREDENLTS